MAIELIRVGQILQSADSQFVLSALIALFVLLLLVLLTITSSVSKNFIIYMIMHSTLIYLFLEGTIYNVRYFRSAQSAKFITPK